MPVPTTERPRSRAATGPALGRAELRRIHRALLELQGELDRQMAAASATLQELREGFSLTDPDIQAPLMTALHALDTAERSSLDVTDALARLEAGTFGTCARCRAPIPAARLELRPAGRYCVSCTR
jgi:RNA polymerase-binding transcription factor DksA